MIKQVCRCEPHIHKFILLKIIILKFVFLRAYKVFKWQKNSISTRKQKKKYKIIKQRSIKSEISRKSKNNKENHKKYQNQGISEIFDIQRFDGSRNDIGNILAQSNDQIKMYGPFKLLF